MAMALGTNTTKLFIGYKLIITNDQYTDGFDSTGDWVGSYIFGGATGDGRSLSELDYVDLGIVTGESENYTVGLFALSLPTAGVPSRINIPLGGKILRLSLRGIIPDGIYHSVSTGDSYDGKSNISVFRLKMAKLLSYGSFALDNPLHGTVQYRRKYLIESDGAPLGTTSLCRWVLTSYNYALNEGARVLQYSIDLDMANNFELGDVFGTRLHTGITPRDFGDID